MYTIYVKVVTLISLQKLFKLYLKSLDFFEKFGFIW